MFDYQLNCEGLTTTLWCIAPQILYCSGPALIIFFLLFLFHELKPSPLLTYQSIRTMPCLIEILLGGYFHKPCTSPVCNSRPQGNDRAEDSYQIAMALHHNFMWSSSLWVFLVHCLNLQPRHCIWSITASFLGHLF